MTLTVLTILTLGVMPLVKVAVIRQREQRLRESLREMRMAIDEFHRDTVGMQCVGSVSSNPNQSAPVPPDPRSHVIISDCTIFGVDNPDHYPPDLETLVKGVSVTPRAGLTLTGSGPSGPNATDSNSLATKKKVYLRAIPIDPFTGKAEWDFRSSYDAADATSWGGGNVFDVHSAADGTGLNGEKYREW